MCWFVFLVSTTGFHGIHKAFSCLRTPPSFASLMGYRPILSALGLRWFFHMVFLFGFFRSPFFLLVFSFSFFFLFSVFSFFFIFFILIKKYGQFNENHEKKSNSWNFVKFTNIHSNLQNLKKKCEFSTNFLNSFQIHEIFILVNISQFCKLY